MAVKKANQKKKQKKEEEENKIEEANPYALKNTHAVTPDLIMAQKKQLLDQHAIQEKQEEESEVSQVNIDLDSRKREIDEKAQFVNMYKRIDQPALTKVGLKPK